MIRQGKTARPALKICGVTNASDLAYCVALGVDYVGLNLAPRSKRYVTPEEAERIVADAGFSPAGGRTRLVAVFVDPTDAEVDRAVACVPQLTALQFHGDETPEAVRRHAQRTRRAAWKALGVRSSADVRRGATYHAEAGVELVLYDAAPLGAERGGTGRTFDWAWLEERASDGKFGVAGGIRPGMREQLALLAPYGPSLLDVCSGVETTPRAKDHAQIAAMHADCLSLGEVEP